MKKIIIATLIVMICVSAFLSGCQDTNSVKTKKTAENVFLDSTVVEFANVSFDKDFNKSGGIDAVIVGWRFHNIAGKMISINIDVQFYNKNNVLLYNTTKMFPDMPAGYTEQYSPYFNRVIYDGPGAPFVDHVVISVTEIV
jgi:hypothetical protein